MVEGHDCAQRKGGSERMKKMNRLRWWWWKDEEDEWGQVTGQGWIGS